MAESAPSSTDDRPTIDFDHHRLEPGIDLFDAFSDLRTQQPIAWSEHHGGFWVVSKYDDVARVFRDHRHFSSTRDLLPSPGTSNHIPPMNTPAMLPAELDPPASLTYRRLLNPILSRDATEQLEPVVLRWVTHYLDQLPEDAVCDLSSDFAAPVPAAVTLEWMGMPLEDLDRISNAYHDLIGHHAGHPRWTTAMETLGWLHGRLEAEMERRREEPRDDVLSYLISSEVDGRPITMDEALSLAEVLFAGGVETTTTAVAWMMVHLNREPEDRRSLIANPALWETAADEFLRRYPPVVYHARTCQQDTEIRGCPISRGERVMAIEASGCHDPEVFPEPERVILDRSPNHHLAFGLGSHRCVGMHLARLEIRVMMAELLRRFPNYRLVEEDMRPYPDSSIVAGWMTIPGILSGR